MNIISILPACVEKEEAHATEVAALCQEVKFHKSKSNTRIKALIEMAAHVVGGSIPQTVLICAECYDLVNQDMSKCQEALYKARFVDLFNYAVIAKGNEVQCEQSFAASGAVEPPMIVKEKNLVESLEQQATDPKLKERCDSCLENYNHRCLDDLNDCINELNKKDYQSLNSHASTALTRAGTSDDNFSDPPTETDNLKQASKHVQELASAICAITNKLQG
ncbi:hypothetical protein ACH5RR_030966 [Cinchona calisaya]|uniref:Pectinesterase inhibitor domain-containing protein n=1 Tax=Cinchona calisaya TaxID=153742 RepID=A0ABD2YHT9_9GENT